MRVVAKPPRKDRIILVVFIVCSKTDLSKLAKKKKNQGLKLITMKCDCMC
jgi:hypothetical protein